MKRILLAILLLLVGGTGFFAMDAVTHRAGQRFRAYQSEWGAQTQRLANLEAAKKALRTKIRDLQLDLQEHSPEPSSDFADLLNAKGPSEVTPEAWEKLRTEMNLNWHSSADWILLSKTTLATVRMNAFKGSKLTDAACGVLAITPEERQCLGDAFAAIREEFAAWAKVSVQREGPNGERLARLTIPPNLELAAGLSNRLASAVLSTLGHQRGDLFHRFADGWRHMEVGGLATGTSVLTVSRRINRQGQPQFHYDLMVTGDQGSRGQSGQIMPNSQYFPNSFKSVFPGGWREVAEREGFELPNDPNF